MKKISGWALAGAACIACYALAGCSAEALRNFSSGYQAGSARGSVRSANPTQEQGAAVLGEVKVEHPTTCPICKMLLWYDGREVTCGGYTTTIIAPQTDIH